MSMITKLDLTSTEVKNFITHINTNSGVITSGNSILMLKEEIREKIGEILNSKGHQDSRPVPLSDVLYYSEDYYKRAKVMELSKTSPNLLKLYKNETAGPVTHLISSTTMINSLVNIISGMQEQQNYDIQLQGLGATFKNIVNELCYVPGSNRSKEEIESILQENFLRAHDKVHKYIDTLKKNYEEVLNKITLGDVIDHAAKCSHSLEDYNQLRRAALILNGIENLHKGYDKDVSEYMSSQGLSDDHFISRIGEMVYKETKEFFRKEIVSSNQHYKKNKGILSLCKSILNRIKAFIDLDNNHIERDRA